MGRSEGKKCVKHLGTVVAVALLAAGGAVAGVVLPSLQDGSSAAVAQSPSMGGAFWSESAATAARQGWLGYNDRSADVQVIMQRMYNLSTPYTTLSALFVDHSPMYAPGSMRISLDSAGTVQADTYGNDLGSGTPTERVTEDGSAVTLYSPKLNKYVVLPTSRPHLLTPLSSLPLTVGDSVTGPTQIRGSSNLVEMANMFVHPAAFVTSTFFENKTVSVLGHTSLAGRSADELVGTLSPKDPVGAQLASTIGDTWRVLVDSATGVLLRLEYYYHGKSIGWAELKNLTIHTGPIASSASAVSAAPNVPPGAAATDWKTYAAQQKGH